MGEKGLVHSLLQSLIDTLSFENLSRDQCVLISELYYLYGQDLETESEEKAIKAYYNPVVFILDMNPV